MTDKISELEAAILSQAQQLANQYREQAQHSRRDILQESHERLQELEEREALIAKSLAERSYRRQVLSQELALQGKLDRLRWGLVRAVYDRLQEALHSLVEDEALYLPLLKEFITRGVTQFDQPSLVVEVNPRDHARLEEIWDDICRSIPAKQLNLSDTPLECIGGVRIRTPDDREQLDQTFEGRIHRLETKLQRLIQETLFPPSPEQQQTGILP